MMKKAISSLAVALLAVGAFAVANPAHAFSFTATSGYFDLNSSTDDITAVLYDATGDKLDLAGIASTSPAPLVTPNFYSIDIAEGFYTFAPTTGTGSSGIFSGVLEGGYNTGSGSYSNSLNVPGFGSIDVTTTGSPIGGGGTNVGAAPTPEASSVVSFSAMIVAGAAALFMGKRRKSSNVA